MSGILPSSTGGQWKGPAGPQRRGVAQRSTQAWNLGSGTGKDTAGMGCRELVTGVGGGKETISTWRTSPRSPWSRKLLPVFLWDGEGRNYFFFFLPLTIPLKGGFPDGSELRILLPVQEAWVQSLGWEVPLRRKWLPTSVFLPSNPMDWGAWGLQSMGSYRVRYDWVCRHCNLIHLDGKWWSWCCGHKLFTSLGLPFPNFNYVVLEELLKHT